MFKNLFRTDPLAKLEREYRELLEASHKLSTVDRKRSDLMRAKAEEVGMRIERLRTNSGTQQSQT
jgi:hypothetical protein